MQELLRRVLKVWEKRLPLTPAQLQALGEEAYARGWGLAGIWEQKFLERIQGSLTTAIAKGSTYSEWTQNEGQKILDGFGAGVSTYRGGKRWDPWYSELVMRNATQASFAGGRYSAMFAPEWQQIAPFVRYYATLDDRTRPAHAALHGRVFRKDDAAARPFYPPSDHGCRCSIVELTLAEVEDAGYRITDGNRIPYLETKGGGTIGRPPGGWDIDRVTANSSRVLKQATKTPAALPPAAPPFQVPAPKPAPRPTPALPPASAPLGTKLSSKATVKAGGKRDLQGVFNLIDAIHGDGNLGHASVVSVTPDRGYYRPEQLRWSKAKRAYVTTPRALNVGRDAKHWRVQLSHEVGHWLDFEGLAPYSRISKARTLAPEVLSAIDTSQAIKDLEKTMARGKRRTYILSDEEKWARAYSQFIAVKSGDAEMLREVALWRSGAIGREADGLWADDDFKPIAAAFETAFRRLGWLT
jgi:SPP1 gp7 family putative phage head morphogenesis protein